MSAILGISAFYHDSAAALVVEGEIVAAAQEERFSRKKHDHEFPIQAVDYCLAEGGIEPADLDYVGFYDKPLAALKAWPKTLRSTMKTRDLWTVVCAKLRGHYAYYSVTDNSPGVARFAHAARRLLKKWFNRRGGKPRLTWEKFHLMEKRFPLPRPHNHTLPISTVLRGTGDN